MEHTIYILFHSYGKGIFSDQKSPKHIPCVKHSLFIVFYETEMYKNTEFQPKTPHHNHNKFMKF